ncbi:MAG: SUMF1/EgtB/PvdO family nonheme iron enzyme [Polyangiaceae bacterium]
MASALAICAVLAGACGQGGGAAGSGETGAAPAPATGASATGAAGTGDASTGSSETGSASSEVAGDAGAQDAAPAVAAPEGMVVIPEGVFLMGGPPAFSLPEERPQHEVAVGRYYLDLTEVTTGAYKKCIADGKCKTTHTTTFCNEPHTDRDDHPINCVDWEMADAYCAAVGKRLPTEREWEYAARGGAEQRGFSWGEEPPTPERACYMHGESCPVKSFAAGAFGLYDMSGNVWEWTSSWFGPYPAEAQTGTHKVYRGGSWSRRFPKWLRNAIRNRYTVNEFSSSIGFRCAKSIEPLVCPKDHEAREGKCARTAGQPWCEPGHPWNGKECSGYDGANKKPEKSPDEIAAEPVVKTRTPQHDEDCKKNYKGKPAAYRFSGNTFHARNPMINGGGCSRRDMGQTWTSACCPN